MTPAMKDKCLRAIALARKPGSCLYIHEGKPCCVIAQLLLLEGGDLEDIKASWIRDNNVHIPIHKVENRGRLAKYPIKVLKELQAIWDYPDSYPYADRLVQMERLVDLIPTSG